MRLSSGESTRCAKWPLLAARPRAPREGLRILKEHDEVRLRWREQIERGWLQAPAGPLVDGPKTMAEIKGRLKSRAKKRA